MLTIIMVVLAGLSTLYALCAGLFASYRQEEHEGLLLETIFWLLFAILCILVAILFKLPTY